MMAAGRSKMAARRLAPVPALLLCFALLSVLYVRKTSCITSYSREELLHIRRITPDNLELFANIPEDILDVNNTGSPPWGNTSSTKRRRTGVVSRFRRWPYRPPLPALILSNVRSLKNKMDELLLLTQTDRNYSDCSAFCFTETWLDQSVPDEAVTPPGFTIFRADRSVKLSLKSKGGGISLMVNQRWCNNSTILHRHCSPDLEFISLKCRPYYPPREFASIILIGVYVPPQANANTAISELSQHISSVENSNPDTSVIVLGDFNHTNLSTELPNYKQQVTCHSRESKTLDHCYISVSDAYREFPRAPLGRSDHAVLLLIPKYRQKLKSVKKTSKSIRSWSIDAIETLKGCFECTNWDIFSAACDSLDELTDTVMSYVKFCEEICIPTKTVTFYGNKKPWFSKDLHLLRKELCI